MKNIDSLFEMNRNMHQLPYVKLNKNVLDVEITAEDNFFTGIQIGQIISIINAAHNKYGRLKYSIHFHLGNVKFIDKLTYVFLECICYYLIAYYGHPVQIFMNVNKDIGTDGISIGQFFVVDRSSKTLKLGNIGENHWTIKSSDRNSYISYNAKKFEDFDEEFSVYVGTNGISLGRNFSVDSKGKLICKEAEINGKITSQEGNIAGWEITSNALESNGSEIIYDKDNNINIKADYSIALQSGIYGGLLIDVNRGSQHGDMSRIISFVGAGATDYIATPGFSIAATGGDLFFRSFQQAVINLDWHKSKETDAMGNRSLYLPNPGIIGVYSEDAASWLNTTNENRDPLERYLQSTTRYWSETGRNEIKDWYKNDGKPNKNNTVSLYQYIRYIISLELGDGKLINEKISELEQKINNTLTQSYYTKSYINNNYATQSWVRNNFVSK